MCSENDALTLSVLEARKPQAVRSEAFGIFDNRQQIATGTRSEPLRIAETYIDLIAFVLKVAESFVLSELSGKQILPKPAAEVFSLGDAGTRQTSKTVAQSLGIIDGRTGALQRLSAETVSLTERNLCLALIPKLEALVLTESRRASIQPDVRQSLTLSETYTDIIGFILQIAEAFAVLDRTSRSQTHLSKEQIALLDRILRASNAVIADLSFRTTPLDEEGFASLISQSKPLGFSAFRDLIPGDYEYAKALVRLILEAPVTTANRVALSQARLNIDVPDVRDRGTVAVAATGTVVAFNRAFNAPPEIQATFKGGTILAIPQIGAITTTGFEILLINPDTQVPVAGNASWSAEGF
ncbi:MAG: hypothetical protein EBU34_10485 [Alphaproteobacteria bacterium]|nr:hypothetical protein [Alphaproteobacteria bacterium]